MSESFWLTVLPAKVVATASNVKSILSLSGSQRRLISRKCKVLLRPEFKEPLPQGFRDLLPKMFVCVCVLTVRKFKACQETIAPGHQYETQEGDNRDDSEAKVEKAKSNCLH